MKVRQADRAVRAAGPGLCVVAAVALIAWRYLGQPPVSWLPLTDIVSYYYPMAQLTARRLAAGEVPLWNPGACSGIPLLATLQIAPFHPGTWLHVLLPSDQALLLKLFLEFLLGAAFAGLFFRAAGAGRFAASLGGLLFFYACLLGQVWWPPAVATIAWIPGQLLCVEQLAHRWRWRWWLGLALATALQLLAGFPQYALYGFYLVGPYALLRLLDLRAAEAWGLALVLRRAAGMAAAVALGAGIAAAQLVPAAELVAQSQRSRPLSAEQVEYLSLATTRAAEFLGNAVDPRPKHLSFDFGRGGSYLGIATVVVLLAGLVAERRSRVTWGLLLLGAVALAISDGSRGAGAKLYELYLKLPASSAFRTPERLRVLALFAAIAIAVRGYDLLASGPRAGRATRRLRLEGLAAAGLAAAGVAVVGRAGGAWRAGVGFALLALASLGGRRRGVRHACQAALFTLVFVDLALASESIGILPFPTHLSDRYYTLLGHRVEGPLVARWQASLRFDRVELVGYLPQVGAEPVHGLQGISCYEPLLPEQWPTLYRRLSGGKSLRQMTGLDPQRFATIYDVASVRKIVLPERPRVNREIENEDALPRAYLVDRYEILPQEVAFDRIAAGGFDFRTGVILDRDPGWRADAAPPLFAPARIASHEPERVVVEVGATRDALLVLTDTYYPGWAASVDGRPAEILRANGLYRAIVVPHGARRVVFEYRPASFRWGVAISALCLATALAVAGAGGLRARRLAGRFRAS